MFPFQESDVVKAAKRGEAVQIIFGVGGTQRNSGRRLRNELHERFEGFQEHGAIFLSVVAVPSFP